MRRSRIMWLEIVGMLPMNILLAPLVAFGAVSIIWATWSPAGSQSHPLASRLLQLLDLAPFLLLVVSGLAGSIGAWMAVLIGADSLRSSPPARWAVVVALLMGLGAAGFWESYVVLTPAATASTWGLFFWCSLLLPAMLVALHQLYLLLRPVRHGVLRR